MNTLSDEILNFESANYLENYADLWLISYAKHVKNVTPENPFVVTEERYKNNKKIVDNIPVICSHEKIDYLSFSQFLPKFLRELFPKETT